MIRINTKTIEKALYNYFCKNIATIDRIQGLSSKELIQTKQGTVWTETAIHHECDILTVSPSYWATEVEIKISVNDLKADFKKQHNHNSKAIKYFYYCIPEHLLQKSLNIIPKNYGILVAKPYKFNENVYCKIEQYRKSKLNKESRKLTEREVSEIWRKTMFRYWNNR